MRKTLLTAMFIVALLTAGAAYAQSPNYDVGPVWRVNYYSLKTEQGDAFWKDFRENLKPVYEELKKEGLITDYKVFLNTGADALHDWDVAVAIAYPNWATLDQLDAKGATIVAKHYGSREAMLEAGTKRAGYRDVVASHLVREVMPKWLPFHNLAFEWMCGAMRGRVDEGVDSGKTLRIPGKLAIRHGQDIALRYPVCAFSCANSLPSAGISRDDWRHANQLFARSYGEHLQLSV